MLPGATTLAVQYPRCAVGCSCRRSTGSDPAGREVYTGAGCVSLAGRLWCRANGGFGQRVVRSTEEETVQSTRVPGDNTFYRDEHYGNT